MVNFEDFQKEWLAEITEGNPNTVELGNRFSRKLISQWLEFEEASEDIVHCDGSGDGGIDIACLQRGETDDDTLEEGDTWYLVQSKYGSAFSGTATLLAEAQKLIDTLDGKRKNLSSLSADLVDRLTNFRAKASEKDKLVLVFAIPNSLSEGEKRAIEDIKAMGKARLGPIFDVELVSIETIYHRTLENSNITNKTNVAIHAHLLVPSGDDVLVGAIHLTDLFTFLKSYKTSTSDLDLLYDKNVRKFLGNKRKVNKGIENTIMNQPERFGLYNNGITIVVEDFKRSSDTDNADYTLTEPYVVNGCQTTKTIWAALLKKLETGGTGANPEIEDWKKRLERGIVVIKIVKVGASVQGEELLNEITRYTNSQNAVSEKDFLALERDFKKWAGTMAAQHDLFLEIQRGGWESQQASQKQNSTAKQFSEHVNAFDLLKVYGAAWLGEAGLAFGKNPPFTPSGSMFKKIINNPEGFGVDDLYAAYLLSKASVQYKFGRGAEKQTRGQTRFLFYMVLVELLKDVMIYTSIDHTSLRKITQSLLNLFKPENKDACDALSENALLVVDEYLTNGNEDSIFTEPKFVEKGSDLNSFLKWEQLGKHEDSTPKLKSLIHQYKISMKKKISSQPSARDLVRDAIREQQIVD